MSINFRGDFGDELDLQRLGDVFGNLVLDKVCENIHRKDLTNGLRRLILNM